MTDPNSDLPQGTPPPSEPKDDLAAEVRALTRRLEALELRVTDLPTREYLNARLAEHPTGETETRPGRIADRLAGRELRDGDDVAPSAPEPSRSAAAMAAPMAATNAVGEMPRRRSRSAAGPIALVLLLIAAGGGAWWYFTRGDADPGQQAAEQALLEAEPDETIDVARAVDDATVAPSPESTLEPPAPEAAPDTPAEEQPPAAADADPEAADVALGEPPEAADDQPGDTVEAEPPTGEADTTEADVAGTEADSSPAAVGPQITTGPGSVEAEPLESIPDTLAPLPDDAPQELRDLAQAALDGDPRAQSGLGGAYAIGDVVDQDYGLARYWFEQAANAGQPNAIYNLGVIYDRGLDVEQDPARAFELFIEAAEAGHPDARVAAGLLYAQGRGVEQDLLQAASWLQAAVSAGSPRGAFHLGRLFESGIDGAPDLPAAAGWYRIAAEAGDAEATQALETVMEQLAAVAAPEPAPEAPAAEEPPAAAAAPATTPQPATPAPAAPTGSDAVREIQRLLTSLGYQPGPVDGLMGQRTADAIRQFQEEAGMPVDGQPSPGLLFLLQQRGG